MLCIFFRRRDFYVREEGKIKKKYLPMTSWIIYLNFFPRPAGDGAKVIEAVGATLIQECLDDRQIRALKSLGGNLYHFLTTLDGVHDVLQMGDDKVSDLTPIMIIIHYCCLVCYLMSRYYDG